MRRTTQNLVKVLEARGVKAHHENTGGGCFCGVIELSNGRKVFFTDDVPDEVYETTVLAWAADHKRLVWKSYDGGFELVDASGDNIFVGTIGGSHSLHAGLATAEDMADEYVKICHALDPDFAPTPPQLPNDMHDALDDFIRAGWRLNEVWNTHMNAGELSWLAAPERYPAYLPSFDQFLMEFDGKLQGER
jgi:hypothetical protein